MLKFPILSALPVFVLPMALAAQSASPGPVEVHGRVVDAATRAPVSDAVVELSDASRRTLSDSAGRFVLHEVKPGTHQWSISRLGYAGWEESTEIEDGDEFTIPLLSRPEMLEGITAMGNQLDHRRLAAGVAVRTLDRATLGFSSAPSAFDVVHDLLGVAGVPCPGDAGDRGCAFVRGDLLKPLVYVDEEPLSAGLSDLVNYRAQDLYTVESYGGGVMIRVISVWFANRLARGRASLMPLAF